MLHPTEKDEQAYLASIVKMLQAALQKADDALQGQAQRIEEAKQYMWQNAAQLDAAEKAMHRTMAFEDIAMGEEAAREWGHLRRLLASPYFGRIDFLGDEDGKERPVYIGVHAFLDKEMDNLIYDWRAPISSMFYDFEQGQAHYVAPMGRIEGYISLKRQYKIQNSRLEYMIESSLNIGDEILQKELSQRSDEKMKNIVATIQREQNEIIRDETTRVLIIQGAAGSGKTSIALHRIAFLLYRFKDYLKAQNVMILSPNKVFGNYISNVLPELGEENVPETRFEDLAQSIVGKRMQFQTFAQQIEEMLEGENPLRVEQLEFKSTNDFVAQLEGYLQYAERYYFEPTDIDIGAFHASKEQILERYVGLKRFPVHQRLEKIAAWLIAQDRNRPIRLLTTKEAGAVKRAVLQMFRFSTPLALYSHFYNHIQRPHLFSQKKRSYLDYCDLFPFIYVKLFFEPIPNDYRGVKHLLVDEMQDYTPIQYAVLAKLFSCKMTILGDCNQSVNPFSSSTAGKISPCFESCNCVELTKSYRSTLEIMALAQHIQRNEKLVPMERHGEAPQFLGCASAEEEARTIARLVGDFKASGFKSLGILCKSQAQAKQLYQALAEQAEDISLLDFESSVFQEGIVVTTVHMSKGLEFDQVIVAGASRTNYATKLERGLLYIACTRAMHKLLLTYAGEPSAFLP